MKKILMSVLVLWAAGAYCQEIRMPDDKRKEYLKEEQKATNSTSLERSGSSDNSREEQRERALEARQRAAAAANSPEPGQMVYCIIREISSPNSNKAKVIIEVDSEFTQRIKELDKKSQIALGLATEKRLYKNALGALNNFSMHGWTLSHVSDYVDTSSEMMVHDYLIGYRIP